MAEYLTPSEVDADIALRLAVATATSGRGARSRKEPGRKTWRAWRDRAARDLGVMFVESRRDEAFAAFKQGMSPLQYVRSVGGVDVDDNIQRTFEALRRFVDGGLKQGYVNDAMYATGPAGHLFLAVSHLLDYAGAETTTDEEVALALGMARLISMRLT